jgi:acetyltransferase-like isoleucine patch superfamily enzyme
MNTLRFKDWLSQKLSRHFAKSIAGDFKCYALSKVHHSAVITNPEFISLLGASVGRGVWLYAMSGDSAGHCYAPELIIGRGSQVGDYCHITCSKRVEIGEDVLMGQRVFISDSNHVYRDIAAPILAQGLTARPVLIGAGTWLGNHAVVVGCSIGRNCVIGANAVVTRDVPDYCVVAGAPARVIKRYDSQAREWVRADTSRDG